MSNITEARVKAIKVLENYMTGEISAKDFISVFPDVADDLLDEIINTFCEPLSDNPTMPSWEEIARISIQAIRGNWGPEFFQKTLEHGLSNKDG